MHNNHPHLEKRDVRNAERMVSETAVHTASGVENTITTPVGARLHDQVRETGPAHTAGTRCSPSTASVPKLSSKSGQKPQPRIKSPSLQTTQSKESPEAHQVDRLSLYRQCALQWKKGKFSLGLRGSSLNGIERVAKQMATKSCYR